jgi:hypothetical protein
LTFYNVFAKQFLRAGFCAAVKVYNGGAFFEAAAEAERGIENCERLFSLKNTGIADNPVQGLKIRGGLYGLLLFAEHIPEGFQFFGVYHALVSVEFVVRFTGKGGGHNRFFEGGEAAAVVCPLVTATVPVFGMTVLPPVIRGDCFKRQAGRLYAPAIAPGFLV